MGRGNTEYRHNAKAFNVVRHFMETLQEVHYSSIYELADLIDGSVKVDVGFGNYNEEYFIQSSSRFSKETLLHLYIIITAVNYCRRDFKNPEFYEDDEDLENGMASSKRILSASTSWSPRKSTSVRLVNSEVQAFYSLFERMADEVFYILFANRNFLLRFNSIVTTAIEETQLPKHVVTKRKHFGEFQSRNGLRKLFITEKKADVYFVTQI